MENCFSLEGKNIIITGASSGIGKQSAIAASQAGANVILIGRDKDRLKETHNLLAKGNHLLFSQDISQYDKLEEIISQTVEQLGKISGFIHSAGIHLTMPLSAMKPERYEKLFSVNVVSGFELARIISKNKYLSENGASFIFIASITGTVGQKALVGYCSSKGALIAGSKAMALELAAKKIRVNCVSPGHINGTMMSDDVFSTLPQESKKTIVDSHPLGLGEPSDVANSCVFLLSKAAKWITGTNLIVDGGYNAQ